MRSISIILRRQILLADYEVKTCTERGAGQYQKICKWRGAKVATNPNLLGEGGKVGGGGGGGVTPPEKDQNLEYSELSFDFFYSMTFR